MAAALMAFERAHREFTHGRFSEALTSSVAADKYSSGFRGRRSRQNYLQLPKRVFVPRTCFHVDADSLYDRGVIELNRGEYGAAQEMFERAIKREPEAAHIHYGLAATRARLGSVDLALQSLKGA